MIKVSFISHHHKARVAPNPAYPRGIDIDLTHGARQACEAPLPYPAECCGLLMVRCDKCGNSAVITTAGRTDDPRSVRLPCRQKDKKS